MKINLLPRCCPILKALLMSFCLFFSVMSFAQNGKVYAVSQTSQRSGICSACIIQNPQNAVGENEDDYAAITIGLGVAGRIQQTLIFPKAVTKNFRKIVIGIGTNRANLSLQLLGGISIETFLGNVSNQDSRDVDNSILKLGQDSNKGIIEFIPNKPFDRVRITYNSGILSLNDEHRIYYIYHAPAPFSTCGNLPLDPLAYYSLNGNINDAISGLNLTTQDSPQFQNNLICNKGVVVSNSLNELQIPQLSIPSGAARTISFWARIMDDAPGLKVGAFGTLMEIRGDGTHFLGESGKELFWANNTKAFNNYTIVYSDQKACLYINGHRSLNYDNCVPWGVQADYAGFTLMGGVLLDEVTLYDRKLSDTEIQTFVCSYDPNCNANACNNPPFNPTAYYSFNGTINDSVSGLNFISSNTPLYQDNLVCNKGLESTIPNAIALLDPQIPASPDGGTTLSFWARAGRNNGQINMSAFGVSLGINPTEIETYKNGSPVAYSNPGEFNHYAIVYSGQQACLYTNGEKSRGITPDSQNNCIEWDGYLHKIDIDMFNAQLDEMVLYNKKLTDAQIRTLARSYGMYQSNSSISSNPVSLIMKTNMPEETFTISPNPTTGQITLDGDISFENSTISINNISGKEVYRSAFRTKTFELPSVLPGGVYILNLQTKEGKIHSRKIILSR